MGEARLHVGETLAPGHKLHLSGDRAHYLRHVLRLRAGEPVRLFNAGDGEWRARLVLAGRHDVDLMVEACIRAPVPEPGPTLVFAPIRRNRMEWLVEKAVELGVERLVPVLTRRTVVKPDTSARLETIAREAAEQCERLTLPLIEAPRPLAEWLHVRTANDPVLVALEREEAAAVPIWSGHAPPTFLVGPEGGFAPEEREALHAAPGVVPISLGPRILRAETAGLALLAAWELRPRSDPAPSP